MTLAEAKIFLAMISKAQYTNEKMYKLDFTKIKNFYSSKNSVKRMKRQ